MLPSSKLLPVTILVIAASLSMRAYAVATTVPNLAALRSSATQILAAASATASNSIIAQAQAAEKNVERAGAKPASGAVQPAALPRPNRPSPATAPSPSMAGPAPAVPAVAKLNTQDVPTTGDVATASPEAPSAMAPSPSDLAALGRNPADERESQTAAREATIAAAEKRLSERVIELVAVQQRLQGLENSLKERDEANWTGLVKLYEGMKPREAAVIFNSLEKSVLIEILDRMKPVKASPILASMDAERARQVTADLATRRTVATAN